VGEHRFGVVVQQTADDFSSDDALELLDTTRIYFERAVAQILSDGVPNPAAGPKAAHNQPTPRLLTKSPMPLTTAIVPNPAPRSVSGSNSNA
jgi:hypothetical protein